MKPPPEHLSPKEREIIIVEQKKKILGTVSFLAHLYLCNIIPERLIHTVIQDMLKRQTTVQPIDIEAIVKILDTCGYKMDRPKANQWLIHIFNILLHIHIVLHKHKIKELNF